MNKSIYKKAAAFLAAATLLAQNFTSITPIQAEDPQPDPLPNTCTLQQLAFTMEEIAVEQGELVQGNPLLDYESTGKITFSSSDEELAAVDENGGVTLKSKSITDAQTVTISAHMEADADYCEANAEYKLVIQPFGYRMEVIIPDDLHYEDLEQPLITDVINVPENATFTYKLESDADFSETIPQGKEAGTYSIEVKATLGSFEKITTVETIIHPASYTMHFEKAKVSVPYGTTVSNPLTIVPEGAVVRYLVENDPAMAIPAVAINETTGEVTVYHIGKAVITAVAEGTVNYEEKKASYELEITPVELTGITLNKPVTEPESYVYDSTLSEFQFAIGIEGNQVGDKLEAHLGDGNFVELSNIENLIQLTMPLEQYRAGDFTVSVRINRNEGSEICVLEYPLTVEKADQPDFELDDDHLTMDPDTHLKTLPITFKDPSEYPLSVKGILGAGEVSYEIVEADTGFVLNKNVLTYTDAGKAKLKITIHEAEDSNYNSASTEILAIVDYAQWEQELIWGDHVYEEKDSADQLVRIWADRQLKIQSKEARMIKWDDQWEAMTEDETKYTSVLEATETSAIRYPDLTYYLKNEKNEVMKVVLDPFGLDWRAPSIASFAFNDKTFDMADTIIPTDYGFFTTQTTKITITAGDDGAGVDTIYAYAEDINGNHVPMYLSKEEADENPIDDIEPADPKLDFEIELKTNEEDQVIVYLPANFKGKLYAKAKDHVENLAEEFVSSVGNIIEDSNIHSQSSTITISINGYDSEKNHPTQLNNHLYSDGDALEDANMEYREKEKLVPLFDQGQQLTIEITDLYSGIQKAEIIVKDENDQNVQSLTLDTTKELPESWNKTIAETSNLVTALKTEEFSLDLESNDITVIVKLTDNAGNVSYDYTVLGIDKTAPEVEVRFSPESGDARFADQFKVDRTAVITVKDRNVDPNQLSQFISLSNEYGSTPGVGGWSSPNRYEYTASITFHDDGLYLFNMEVTDFVSHRSNALPAEVTAPFVIDQTKPVIEVQYDNNASMNGNYYNQDRIATIIITEKNFEPDNVTLTTSAMNLDQAVEFPGLSNWSKNGDQNIATIHYAQDALYTFDIDFTDKAGNVMDDVTPEEFYLDKTAPVITIENVMENTAYNDEVKPQILFEDTNIDANGLVVELLGSLGREDERYFDFNITPYDGTQQSITYSYSDFEHEKGMDDLYTLNASMTDMAGNITEATILFSVNRFGSNYSFEGSLNEIVNNYSNQERDIVILETNVDELIPESIHIKVSRDGNTQDLVQDQHYQVEAGNAGSWHQYRYTINKSVFASDGRYTVTVSSQDIAGNINENIDESKVLDREGKKAEIVFAIDKTKPAITLMDYNGEKEFAMDAKEFTASIQDNLALNPDSIEIRVNEEAVPYQESNGQYHFTVSENNRRQSVRIIAADKAGNINDILVIDGIIVSANWFVRFWNNQSLVFMTGLAFVAAICAGLAAFIVIRKRKAASDSEE